MSKSTNTEITLQLAPSTTIHPDLPPYPEPFKQVVGIKVAERLLTLPEHKLPDPHRITERRYAVSSTLASRLGHYLSHQSTHDSLAIKPANARGSLRFGVWAWKGILFPDSPKISDIMSRNERHICPAVDTQSGEMSIIKPLKNTPNRTYALHGIVKLDDKTDDYMQLTTSGGVLAVTSLEEALDYRESPFYAEHVARAVFRADPLTRSVGHFSVSGLIFDLPKTSDTAHGN